jgi:hypothetical protein
MFREGPTRKKYVFVLKYDWITLQAADTESSAASVVDALRRNLVEAGIAGVD